MVQVAQQNLSGRLSQSGLNATSTYSGLRPQTEKGLSSIMFLFGDDFLTLSMPAGPNCRCSDGSAPYWSNPQF